MRSEDDGRPIRPPTSFVPGEVPAKDASLEILVDTTAVRALTFTGEPDAWTSPLPLDDRPARGTVLDDRYEIGDLLGQGGMGYVLAAKHVVLGKRFAIKVLRPELCASTEMVERFELEARLASSIGHPNIVEVTDFGTLPAGEGPAGEGPAGEGPAGEGLASGGPSGERKPRASYFVMEHLEGESLAARLGREGRLEVADAVDVVRQMASALGAAHAAGIVHRDVKAENVILTTRGDRTDHVKLLDFGIAKLESASGGQGRPVVLGTPAYMSPEQARGLALDARSDIYALGVVLFELLTGELPFDAPHPRQIMALHASQPPPSLASFDLGIPPVVVNLVAAMLAKEASARPPSMDTVIQTLVPIPVPARPARRTPLEAPRPIALAPAPAPEPVSTLAPEGPRAEFTRPARAPAIASEPAPARSNTTTVVAALALTALVAAIALAILIARQRPAPATPTASAPALPATAAPEPAAPPPPTPTAVVAASPEIAPASPPSALAPHPHAAHPPTAPTSAPGAAPDEPGPSRPATFGEQLLMDPWEAPQSQ